MASPDARAPVAVIGGGPAGLMAAEVISQAGYPVALYDAMPSVGRKFLLAGVGGMNITHAEPRADFVRRYGARQALVANWLERFDADALRAWVHALGIETFVGTSGRVFPREMKAAPLLRAWLHRLRAAGVSFYPRHRWLGWHNGHSLRFDVAGRAASPQTLLVTPSACVLALGGASWARLGSDGAWVSHLRERGVPVVDLQPANCGFLLTWSEHLRAHHAGEPLKNTAFSTRDHLGQYHHTRGEAVVSERGIEGGAIYALSAPLREQLNRQGSACLTLDLLPDLDEHRVLALLNKPRGKNSFNNHLRKTLKLSPLKVALLWEQVARDPLTQDPLPQNQWQQPHRLAQAIKALPLTLAATYPIDEAISSAGGVAPDALTAQLMLRDLPGIFCAGEMLDWEAPTGGYLLTACLASGQVAGRGVVEWLGAR